MTVKKGKGSPYSIVERMVPGTVVRVTSFMLFTQTLVEFHTVKTYPGAMQWSLSDYELVILALLTGTFLQVKI